MYPYCGFHETYHTCYMTERKAFATPSPSKLSDRLGMEHIVALGGVVGFLKGYLKDNDDNLPGTVIDMLESMAEIAEEANEKIVGFINEEIKGR